MPQYAYCLLSVACLMILLTVAPVAIGADANKVNNHLNQDAVNARSNHNSQIQCLSSGDGYLRARLNGSLQAELDWRNNNLNCAGSVRPDGNGLRLRFSHAMHSTHPLILLFGIKDIHEGESGKVLAVNVTIIREGRGEFYSTQGDKCTIDQLQQSVLPGSPTKNHSYRVEAHGFCNQPARALNGNGSVLITRFDFAGRVDALTEDDSSLSTNN